MNGARYPFWLALLGALLLLLPGRSHACVPMASADSTTYLWSANGTGIWAAWWCSDGYRWTNTLYAQRWDAVTPELRADVLAALKTTPTDAQLTALATKWLQLKMDDPAIQPIWEASAGEILALKPPAPKWAVKLNGTTLTRPAYPFAAGVRGTTSTERATVGAPCDCATRSVEGASVYCEPAPALVALCTRVAP